MERVTKRIHTDAEQAWEGALRPGPGRDTDAVSGYREAQTQAKQNRSPRPLRTGPAPDLSQVTDFWANGPRFVRLTVRCQDQSDRPEY